MSKRHRGKFQHWNQVWALWYSHHPLFFDLDTSGVEYQDVKDDEMARFCGRRQG